ncbi:phosphate acyltransferase PlsX [Candidatus Methylacidithermus pantelleriae]|uniref:Phosphate acyltransferase n=1 Tax=Candidatus Methylacidithermus pantelleriae TaxID=2744239 RepID=A0A8J2FXE9_9BACT|nr:phosphate acyltransferase PlsX [Candidatus Methylacidithermus pantelleriae]CAF0704964.1 Phosphate acyltransferase [Candidatus Methylacidithermus pantelleriae]
MKIALDAMGGDYAPSSPVAGAVLALQEFPDLELLLVGDQTCLERELHRHSLAPWQDRVQVVHTSQVVAMGESGIESVRRKKDSSISRCVELVKNGAASALVSAGHTGATVAAATIKLRTLPGIDRPGIASVIPAEEHPFVLIDSGANVDAEPAELVAYAFMGSIYAEQILGIVRPRVALLSIGTEDLKGNELTREAFKLLTRSSLNFVGNIEGRDLFQRPVDVVVCDGFVGNVVLKTAEAAARAVMDWLKRELKRNVVRKMGAFLALGAFRTIRRKTDPDEYGGALLLGVNGTCIIAHGASSPKAIKNALRVARDSVKANVNGVIVEEVRKYHEQGHGPRLDVLSPAS